MDVHLNTVLAPNMLDKLNLKGAACVVIDVLRASTVIVTAFANGASEIKPCVNANEARDLAASLPAGSFLLGGEEKGKRIDGFHIGNSPLEYDANTVRNKLIFLSTTNGTPLLRKVNEASKMKVYIGAIVNIFAVSSAITKTVAQSKTGKIVLVCAGQDGMPAEEDAFCAGMLANEIVEKLKQLKINLEIDDDSKAAIIFAAKHCDKPLTILSNSRHGRYLSSIGFEKDVKYASQINKYNIVPVFDGDRLILSHI